MGDRHAGVKRCLHPQERREFISVGDFGRPRERCLDCRAMRERLIKAVPGSIAAGRYTARWSPWVSAGEQVKQALLAQEPVVMHGTLSLEEWTSRISRK